MDQRNEALGRTILEAHAGLHGAVAKEMADELCKCLEDADRYDWLVEALISDDPQEALAPAFERYGPDKVPTRAEFDAGIDAARNQTGGN